MLAVVSNSSAYGRLQLKQHNFGMMEHDAETGMLQGWASYDMILLSHVTCHSVNSHVS